MAKETKNTLQDAILNYLRKKKMLATFSLTGGEKIHGLVTSFDHFSILISRRYKIQLIYKHAICSISPSENIQIFEKSTEKTSGSAPSEAESKEVSD